MNLLKIEACFPKQVYVDFVNGKMRIEPTLRELEQHLDSCFVCVQAVRVIERAKRPRPPGWV